VATSGKGAPPGRVSPLAIGIVFNCYHWAGSRVLATEKPCGRIVEALGNIASKGSALGSRERSSVIAFGAFWVVIALGVLLGYAVVQALGVGGRAAGVSASARHPARHISRDRTPPALTVSSIFAANPPSLARYDRRKLRTLIATGDVIPARSVNYKMLTYNDFLYPWRPTAAYLRTGDITLINLESPLIAGCPTTNDGFTFCGDPRAVQGLTFAGVKVACTANNHIGNYGNQGIQETWTHLRAAGIGYCGLGNTFYRTVRGLTFGFLAYNCVGERFNYAAARREIRAARKRADVVVVSVHWGKEYVAVPATEPGIADDDPVRVAHWIVDSGADLIIGNHPHHVQSIEIYHHRLINYAHGNFIFDQMFSDETRQGVVGTYTFYGSRLVQVRYRPIFIYDYAQPRWATPAQAQVILHEMQSATWQLARGQRA
jgi:poly-gamma-glutamate capsule biosynthesis protein CapA/YwtB (metallophosphatase superfamily)